jgi:hypothetical protein
MKFSHLKSLDPQDSAWMDLPWVAPKARLLLRIAQEKNKPYFNALLKKLGQKRSAARMKSAADADDWAESRDEDRVMFARYILAGWEGIEDVDGNGVAFSAEEALEFLQDLPDWLFDKIRVWASQHENFLPEGEEAPEAKELAGN